MSRARPLVTGLISAGVLLLIAGAENLATNVIEVDHTVGYALVIAGALMLVAGSLILIFSPSESAPPAANVNTAGRDATQKVAGRDYYDFGGIKASSASDEEVTPNVVFDGFSPVDDQPIQWHDQRISHATLAEFARVQFVNEPDRRGASANIDDLHARIDIKELEGEETLLSVKDGKWFENADRGEGLGRDTKSTNLPCNGETRTLDVVMRPHGLNECHGWDHRGFAIPLPTIPTGEYQVWIELDASTMPERRQFRFLLINPVQLDEHGQIDPGSFITSTRPPASGRGSESLAPLRGSIRPFATLSPQSTHWSMRGTESWIPAGDLPVRCVGLTPCISLTTACPRSTDLPTPLGTRFGRLRRSIRGRSQT